MPPDVTSRRAETPNARVVYAESARSRLIVLPNMDPGYQAVRAKRHQATQTG
jgi:hypothetical protein